MSDIHISFSNSKITDSNILNNTNIGSTVVNVDKALDLQKIIEGLTTVLKNSTDKTERRCAERALGLIQKNKMEAFWDYVKKNLGTFLTGTFANVAGGVLLEIIKVKFGL